MHVGVAVRHPEHARFYRPVVDELRNRGHEVSVLVREHGHTTDLLSQNGLSYTVLAGEPATRGELLAGHVLYEARLLRCARARDVDVLTAVGGLAVSHVAPLARASSVVFLDWGPSGVDRLVASLADVVCTPPFLAGEFGDAQSVYAGLHELSYMRPGRGEWRDAARTDAGPAAVVGAADPAAGWPDDVRGPLSERGPVCLVADDGEDWERVRSSPDEVRPLLANADVCVSDRGTLTVEAALSGCPTVHVGPTVPMRCRYLQDEYGLVVTASPDDVRERVAELLADDAAATWKKRRRRALDDTVDVPRRVADLVLGAA